MSAGSANSLNLILFFIQLLVMLGSGILLGQVARRWGLPTLIGELLAGVLLGPTLLGAMAPDFQHWLFPNRDTTYVAREALIELGMLFFLFVAGLEVNTTYLKQKSLSIGWTSLAGIAVPFLLGVASVAWFPEIWGSAAQDRPTTFALFMGTALSISALPVIARVLMDLGLIDKPLGTIIMGAATIDDVIGWSLFAAILASLTPEGAIAGNLVATFGSIIILAVVALTLGRRLGRRCLNWVEKHLAVPGSQIAVSALVVLFAATLTASLGTHAVFGPFLAGVALAEKPQKRNHGHEMIYQFVVSFFAPLYFVSVGLRVDFAGAFDVWMVMLVLTLACLGKIGGVALGALISKVSPREALAIGFGMNARGAMGMILASVALQQRLIDERIFVALIFMAIVTSVSSGPAMKWLLRGPDPVQASSDLICFESAAPARAGRQKPADSTSTEV